MEWGGLHSFRLYQFLKSAPNQSPALHVEPVLLKHGLGLGLGEVIAPLLVRGALDYVKFVPVVGFPEPVPLGK